MTTVAIEIGGRRYIAAKLTLAQFREASIRFDAIQELATAPTAKKLSELSRLSFELSEILHAAICRADGGQVTAEKLQQDAEPGEIYFAIAALIEFSPPETFPKGLPVN